MKTENKGFCIETKDKIIVNEAAPVVWLLLKPEGPAVVQIGGKLTGSPLKDFHHYNLSETFSE